MKQLLVVVALSATLSGAALAQNASAFNPVTINGLTVSAGANNTFTVNFANNASVTHDGETCSITGVTGFYLLSDNTGITSVGGASFSSGNGSNWSFLSNPNNNVGPYDVVGYRINGAGNGSGVASGGSQAFQFNPLVGFNNASTNFGFRVEYADPSCGAGQFIRVGAVPEPASLACLGLGALALVRKRRAAKS